MKKIQNAGAAALLGILLILAAYPAGADESHVYPLLQYEYASFGNQGLHSPGVGLMGTQNETLFLGFYTLHHFSDPLAEDLPHQFHSLDLLYDGGRENHRFIALFKSEAEEPLIGGFSSFQTAGLYGYRLIHSDRTSLVLGLGLALGDFGIETKDGGIWPLIPVPLIRYTHDSRVLSASFDFITGPNLNLTFRPERQFRVKGDFRMDQFRDMQDLVFDLALVYRFFDGNHPSGDFAGVEAGVKNDAYAFDVSSRDDPAELNYYTVYGGLDLTLLKLTSGYVLQGRSRLDEEATRALGDGFYVSIQGMYQF